MAVGDGATLSGELGDATAVPTGDGEPDAELGDDVGGNGGPSPAQPTAITASSRMQPRLKALDESLKPLDLSP